MSPTKLPARNNGEQVWLRTGNTLIEALSQDELAAVEEAVRITLGLWPGGLEEQKSL